MDYQVGQALIWIPAQKWREEERVTVVGLRAHGQAKLSNGWVVDVDGVADGTSRMPGGRVKEIEMA